MLNLTAGGLSGGYRKYLHRVVPMLRTEESIEELLVVVPPGHEHQAGIGAGAWSWRDGEHLRGYPTLRERVRAWKPDVVYIPTARYIDCQAPTVCMVQNMLPMLPQTLRDGIGAWAKLRVDAALARYASQTATRVIAVSDFVKEYLVQQWSVPADRVSVVYHGVDVAERTSQNRASLRLPDTPFVFAAGSLYVYRGLEDAIRALPLTASPDLKLVIAGEGSPEYRQRMESMATALGVSHRVIWLGQVNPSDMTYAYQQCAAFLMTSRVEACPNIALEAMASGARCISTTCPPMPEFFAEHALYYERDDAATMASHINTVANTPAEMSEIFHTNARLRAEHFTWRATTDGVVEQLQAAIAVPNARTR